MPTARPFWKRKRSWLGFAGASTPVLSFLIERLRPGAIRSILALGRELWLTFPGYSFRHYAAYAVIGCGGAAIVLKSVSWVLVETRRTIQEYRRTRDAAKTLKQRED